MCPICQTDRNYGGIGIYIGSCSGCNGGFYFCTTVTDLLRRKNDGIDLYRFYSVILIGVVSFAMRREFCLVCVRLNYDCSRNSGGRCRRCIINRKLLFCILNSNRRTRKVGYSTHFHLHRQLSQHVFEDKRDFSLFGSHFRECHQQVGIGEVGVGTLVLHDRASRCLVQVCRRNGEEWIFPVYIFEIIPKDAVS